MHACRSTLEDPTFDKHNKLGLASIDRLWTKTRTAEGIFMPLGRPITWIGFDSEDRFQPEVPKEPHFLHLAGKSRHKGTARLLELWRTHPEWPSLTVVRSREPDASEPAVSNIVVLRQFLPDSELRRLQNTSAFHLCPSETEGWGHYIVEALSTGAVTLTLDAPPMNELVTAERGLLVQGRILGSRRLATTYGFDAASMAAAIEAALALEPARRRTLGDCARAWFETNKRGFDRRVEAALNEVLG